MSFILQPVCNYSDCIWNMAVPVGITALSSNNNVIQKASTKHYLHNILLSYTKAVFITVSPHHWYLQKKRSNVIIIKKNYYWKHRETKTPFKQVRKQIRGNYRNTHTCAHTRCKSLMRWESFTCQDGTPRGGGGATVLRIVSLTGSQVLVIGLFSHTDTHSYTSTHTHTHSHTYIHTHTRKMQSLQKFKSKLFPTVWTQ